MKTEEFMNVISNISDNAEIEQKTVSENELIQIFEAYKGAPSAANTQPGELYLVYNKKVRERLLDSTFDAFMRNENILKPEWILTAPVVMVICINLKRARARLGEKGDDIAKMDVWGGVQNLRIFANLLGMGTSVSREFSPDRVTEVLDLPKYIKPIGIIGLGYLKSKTKKNERPLLENSMFVHTIKES